MLVIVGRKISHLQPFLKKAVKHGKDGDFRQLQGKNSGAPKASRVFLIKQQAKNSVFPQKT